MQQNVTFAKKIFTQKLAKDKNHEKLEPIVILLVNTGLQHIVYVS